MLTLSYATHRSCVGRNLANLELLVIVASIFRRYHFVLEDPDMEVRLLTRSIALTLTAICLPYRSSPLGKVSYASRSNAESA